MYDLAHHAALRIYSAMLAIAAPGDASAKDFQQQAKSVSSIFQALASLATCRLTRAFTPVRAVLKWMKRRTELKNRFMRMRTYREHVKARRGVPSLVIPAEMFEFENHQSAWFAQQQDSA